MSFIKAQKVVRNADGHIISGSAAIVDAVYVNTGQKNHSRHVVREKLGRVLFLSDDKKQGIFLSPTRGLVEYSSLSDTFSEVDRGDQRLAGLDVFPGSEIHTVFGDAYLLLEFLEKSGLIRVLRAVFPKDEGYERVLCHLLHGILKDGSRISCEDFITKSFVSYLCTEVPLVSLRSDTRFFQMMGSDSVKVSFFRPFVAMMREKDAFFGKGCYVDSIPFPNESLQCPVLPWGIVIGSDDPAHPGTG